MIILFFLFSFSIYAKEVVPTKIDDSIIKLEKKWIQCDQDFDCVEIHYGCSGISSSNRKYSSEAQRKAYKEGGDSRAMNCEIPKQKYPAPIAYECRQGICGAYQYPACEDQECKKPYPKCEFETKWSSELNNFEGVGFVRTLWGQTSIECENRCEDQVKRLKARISQPVHGQYQLECRFKDKVIFKKSLD